MEISFKDGYSKYYQSLEQSVAYLDNEKKQSTFYINSF